MRIGIIGHFGGEEDFTDGQTVKVKALYRGLITNVDGKYKIDKVDTYYLKHSKLLLVCSFLKCLLLDKKIIFLPATHGRRVLFKLMNLCAIVFRKDIYHDCIGGALTDELETRKEWVNYLNSFKANWMESKFQVKKLEECGVKNAKFIPNFKQIDPLTVNELDCCAVAPYAFCTFSRVLPEKGIEDAVEAINFVNENVGKKIATLDIYGPIQAGCEEWFDTLISKNSENCKYCGVVPPNDSVQKLKPYFALLFPTRYYREGMPGTIIDALFAGLPIISREWAYCNEMVENGVTGYTYAFDSPDLLNKIVLECVTEPEIIVSLKKKCIEKAQMYTENRVISQILNEMQL